MRDCVGFSQIRSHMFILDKHKDLASLSFKLLWDVFTNNSDVLADVVILLIRALLAIDSKLKVFIDFGKVCAYASDNDYFHRLYQISTIFVCMRSPQHLDYQMQAR